jgi:predicted lipoprotein with Yx(FWY)xxD motif
MFVVALAALSATRDPAFGADIDGFALCTAPGDQLSPVVVADGAGGSIVAWHDQRPSVALGGVCFAQRVNATGSPQWALNGVPLSTTGDPGDPTAPAIAADGAGGAFVAYGGSSSQPRAQWVNAVGSPQWGADGTQLTAASPTMRDLAIVRDLGGAGGAIVVWRQDNGAAGLSDIYAQKVSAAGVIQWGSQGIPVTTTNMNGESLPVLLSDGAGGAIIVFFLGSNGCRAQRLNASGVSQWGTTILSSLTNNRRPAIVTDGSGGAVVAWAAGNTGIFAQRLTSAGDRLWSPTNAGVQISTTGNQCTMIPDGAGGATVAWQDNRTGTNFNIYAQRVNGTGATQWTVNGVPVSAVQDDQLAPTIVTDGGTGAILTWYDGRSLASGDDIYAQRIDAAGNSQWTPDGRTVCTVANDQQLPTIAADGAGGAFVCWQDLRSGTNTDIYMHHLDPNGLVLSVPGGIQALSIARAWPNPFLESVRLAFVLPAAATVRLEVFDVRGRCVRAHEPGLLAAGEQALAWDGRSSAGSPAGPGIYYLRVTGPGIALARRVVRLE